MQYVPSLMWLCSNCSNLVTQIVHFEKHGKPVSYSYKFASIKETHDYENQGQTDEECSKSNIS